jgi:hypothetical protein
MLSYYEKRIGRFWFHGGMLKGLAIGFSIDRYHFMLDLGIIWFGVEW